MRRVVVSGLGVVAPNGVGKEAFWSACREGHSGVGPIRSFDASGHPVQIAAEVPPDWDVTPYIPSSQRKSLKIMSRAMRFLLVCSPWSRSSSRMRGLPYRPRPILCAASTKAPRRASSTARVDGPRLHHA